ncbi:hypothetical protein OKA05_25340 [Luteolibacter arcticus]|uniref:Uncharacterized protein n=1 Tax=Luteolibacter arcticus TaxID=1581411 RepID=A0ABT3GQV7_9BACT|nr:hypothetical protein [Luteolibacter arcticus]MCW1925909.1 hypothetical protein [Luteolibacter arcticus]
MNRLIRTALTLFASASVLIFLVLKRLEDARKMMGQAQASEVQIANFGLIIAAVMMAIGLGLVITALVRSRKEKAKEKQPADHG